MNVVALIGNVVEDPKVKYTPENRCVCSFRIAVSREGGDEADFFTVVTYEKQAEVCNQYLTKGRRVGIQGRMHHYSWPSEDGPQTKVEIVANRVELLGRK